MHLRTGVDVVSTRAEAGEEVVEEDGTKEITRLAIKMGVACKEGWIAKDSHTAHPVTMETVVVVTHSSNREEVLLLMVVRFKPEIYFCEMVDSFYFISGD